MKKDFYYRYLYSYDFTMKGKVTYKILLKLLKLPWNLEL